MALSTVPLPSPSFADFGQQLPENSAAATIRYDLPLPNSHSLSLVTPIAMSPNDFLTPVVGMMILPTGWPRSFALAAWSASCLTYLSLRS
jgi:hypothetical protein